MPSYSNITKVQAGTKEELIDQGITLDAILAGQTTLTNNQVAQLAELLAQGVVQDSELAELLAQGVVQDSELAELLAQGTTLDSILSGQASNATEILAQGLVLDNLYTEQLAQGVVQDTKKLTQDYQRSVQEEILLQLKILTKHWEIANDEIITERDLI